MALNIFKNKLPRGWEIYLEPHLNGCCPDIVLLNPSIGIAVFMVHEARLSANDERDRDVVHDAISQVDRHKDEIFYIYCPRLTKKIEFSVITAGLIFPFARERNLNELAVPFQKHAQYNPITGYETIKNKDIEKIYPGAFKKYDHMFMTEDIANDLKSWIIEPSYPSKPKEDFELGEFQKRLAFKRTRSGYRRIRGPAGSGKSIIVSAKASRLASMGKKVLVVSYNITLLRYLRDLVSKYGNNNSNKIVWMNFHCLCRRLYKERNIKEYREVWENYFSNDELEINDNLLFRITIPKIIFRSLEKKPLVDRQKYDAVLVDEGQDFDPLWWDVLRRYRRRDGEMFLASDITQDIYGTGKSWTDENMLRAGFRGRWMELETTYRLPNNALEKACIFANKFLPKKNQKILPKLDPKMSKKTLELFYPDTLKWVQVEGEKIAEVCAKSILEIINADENRERAMADLTLMTDSNEVGLFVAKILEKKGIKTIHSFTQKQSGVDGNQRRKFAFWAGDTRVKLTTLHSFKGWESRLLVIGITNCPEEGRALFYTGITRLKKHKDGSFLTVVCAEPDLEEFGRMWQPHFSKRS